MNVQRLLCMSFTRPLDHLLSKFYTLTQQAVPPVRPEQMCQASLYDLTR